MSTLDRLALRLITRFAVWLLGLQAFQLDETCDNSSCGVCAKKRAKRRLVT